MKLMMKILIIKVRLKFKVIKWMFKIKWMKAVLVKVVTIIVQ